MKIKFERQGKMIFLAIIISLIVSLLPVTATIVIGQQQNIFYGPHPISPILSFTSTPMPTPTPLSTVAWPWNSTNIVVDEIFGRYLHTGESVTLPFNVPTGASQLVAEIVSVSGEPIYIVLVDPTGVDVISKEASDYFRTIVDWPSSGTWNLKLTGRGDTSNYFKGIVRITSGRAGDQFQDKVNQDGSKFYYIEVEDGTGKLNITLESMSKDNISLRVYSPEGKRVYEEYSSGKGHVVGFNVPYPMPGTWKIEAYGLDTRESHSGEYRIIWSTVEGLSSFPQATGLALLTKEYFAGYVTQDQSTFYGVNVEQAASHLSIYLESSSKDNIYLVVYSPDGRKVYEEYSSGKGHVVGLNVPYPMPGTWKIEAHGPEKYESSSGHFSGWAVVSKGIAPTIPPLKLDYDWFFGHVAECESVTYELAVPPRSERLIVNLESMSKDNIYLMVYSPEGKRVYEEYSSGKGHVVGLNVPYPMPGTWKIEAYGSEKYESGSGAYTGQVTLLPSKLPHYPSTLLIDGMISQGKTNNHKITIGEAISLVIVWIDIAEGNDLDIKILNPYKSEVRKATYSGLYKITSMLYPYAGDWTIRVYGKKVAGEAHYTLHVLIVPLPGKQEPTVE